MTTTTTMMMTTTMMVMMMMMSDDDSAVGSVRVVEEASASVGGKVVPPREGCVRPYRHPSAEVDVEQCDILKRSIKESDVESVRSAFHTLCPTDTSIQRLRLINIKYGSTPTEFVDRIWLSGFSQYEVGAALFHANLGKAATAASLDCDKACCRGDIGYG